MRESLTTVSMALAIAATLASSGCSSPAPPPNLPAPEYEPPRPLDPPQPTPDDEWPAAEPAPPPPIEPAAPPVALEGIADAGPEDAARPDGG